MKTFLASLLLVSTLAPLAPTASAVDACGLECLVAHPCLQGALASACVEVTVECVTATASVHSQTVTVYRSIAGQSVGTEPIDVGPVHISGVTVSTDPVVVGPYTFVTPGRNVSNALCTSQVLA
jgi:hypothetical protein